MDFCGWYAVKLLYKITIHKKPYSKRIKLFGRFYSSKRKQFFEESILLVYADSFEQAYEQAEKKAKKNCTPYINLYGQKVKTKVYKWIDCFFIDKQLEKGTEIYSSIFLEKKKKRLKRRYKSCCKKELYMLRNF